MNGMSSCLEIQLASVDFPLAIIPLMTMFGELLIGCFQGRSRQRHTRFFTPVIQMIRNQNRNLTESHNNVVIV